jgi:hypothetical protein
MLGPQELVDGIDHHAQHLLVLRPQLRIGKKLLFENVSGNETFGDAHHVRLVSDVIYHQIKRAVMTDVVAKFAVQVARRRRRLPAE